MAMEVCALLMEMSILVHGREMIFKEKESIYLIKKNNWLVSFSMGSI
jgi:hypothetical protein